MSLKTRLWVLITVGLSILIVVFGLIGGMLPQFDRAASIRADADTNELLIDTQRVYLTRLENAENDLDSLSDELRELERALPISNDWPRFLAQLAALEKQSGAVLADVVATAEVPPIAEAEGGEAAGGEEPQGVAGSLGLTEIPLTISVTGTADQVARYFELLQTGERLILVRSLALSGDAETTLGSLEGSIFFGPV